jgi:hypothetical protein
MGRVAGAPSEAGSTSSSLSCVFCRLAALTSPTAFAMSSARSRRSVRYTRLPVRSMESRLHRCQFSSESRFQLHRDTQKVWPVLAPTKMHQCCLPGLIIHQNESARQRARELVNTPEFAKAQRQRKKVEVSFADLKNQIGLRRLRLRDSGSCASSSPGSGSSEH